MNFGFDFSDKEDELNTMNQTFYRRLLEDKIKILEKGFIKDDKKKNNGNDSDDSDDEDDDKPTRNTVTPVKDGPMDIHQPGKKRVIKVLALVQEPYIYKKSGKYTGIVYDIWKSIKVELSRKYDFEETFIKTLNYTKQLRRVQNGEFHLALTSLTTNAKRSKMINFTRPLFINQKSILTKPKQGYAEYMGKIAYKLFLPPLALLIVFGIVLGNIMYFVEPKRGYKRAIFSSIASMFGEMGMISENTGLKPLGVVVAFTIMTISFYFSIFLQAATTEKLMEFKRDDEINASNIHTKQLLYAKGSGMGTAFKRLGADVKGVKVDSIDELKKKYIDEEPRWDGIAMSFMDAFNEQDEDFLINKNNFGLNEEAIAVRIGENRLLKDLDIAITRLQDTYEIRKIYNSYFGDKYDFMGIL